jgi:lysophospholipase L1-like esterase
MLSVYWMLIGLLVLSTVVPAGARAARPLPDDCRRVVFLGSSTTDGHTFPALFRQALVEAGYAAPVCINAGIGGNTTAQMAARLERDVLAYAPTLVVLQAGGNDPSAKVPPEGFRATVTALLARLQREKIPLLVLTTNIRGPKLIDHEPLLQSYNDILRALGGEPGCRVGEVFARQAAARAAGESIVENDSLHANFAGHRVIVRAILDALGFPGVAVPAQQRLELLPGVIRTWRLHPHPDQVPKLDAAAVAALAPDGDWLAYAVPETQPQAHWWLDSERQRGFAVSLKGVVGPAKRYLAAATLQTAKAGPVYFNAGANLQAVWLDGVRIYQVGTEPRGWHAGRERIPVTLTAGAHALLIESGAEFFLSVTETHDW